MTVETEPPIAPTVPAAAAPQGRAKFVTGSLLGHILSMSAAGGVGLVALFIGDLVTIQFLSQLNQVEPVAAVSYASTVLFVSTSVGIGLSIAASATVSRAIGARDMTGSRRLAGSALVLTAIAAVALNLALWIAARPILMALGAAGTTLDLATLYLRIMVPFQTALLVAMTASGLLRAVGDARGAMNITIAGAAVTLVLDAVLILGLGLGVTGAACAGVAGRLAMLGLGLWLVIPRFGGIVWPSMAEIRRDAVILSAIAGPAVLTNIATPVSNIYLTGAIATYGDEAVAAWGIIGRLTPVAFGAIFALSGSIGPIVGQNYGAGRIDRVSEALMRSVWVTLGICAVAWAALWGATDLIIAGFKARGQTAELIRLFTVWLSPTFVFMGLLFVANAFFNTLGKPHWATAVNWGRATLGTVPFVALGGWLGGANGVLIGNTIGQMAFGLVAVWLCRRLVLSLVEEGRAEVPSRPVAPAATPA